MCVTFKTKDFSKIINFKNVMVIT